MAKTKYKVVTPYGEFTRSTDRTYTHIVIVCGRPAGWLELRNQWAVDSSKKQVAEYTAYLNGTKQQTTYYKSSDADLQRWIAEHQANLEKYPAQLAARLEENQWNIDNKQFHCETWCGRYDLAVKAAAKLRKDFALVEIVEVPA